MYFLFKFLILKCIAYGLTHTLTAKKKLKIEREKIIGRLFFSKDDKHQIKNGILLRLT